MLKRSATSWIVATVLVAAMVLPAVAGTVFDESSNGIWLKDYPEGFPCTLKIIKVAKHLPPVPKKP